MNRKLKGAVDAAMTVALLFLSIAARQYGKNGGMDSAEGRR